MDYCYLEDIWFNVFVFSIEMIPTYRLVFRNWRNIVDESKTLQQSFAQNRLNNRAREKILYNNLPIFPKLHLLLDGLPINNQCVLNIVKLNRTPLLLEYFAVKSFVKVDLDDLKEQNSIDNSPVLEYLFQEATLQEFNDIVPLLNNFYSNFSIKSMEEYFERQGFIWELISYSSLFKRKFEDCVHKCMTILSRKVWSTKCDEFLAQIFCKSPNLFHRCVTEKVDQPSPFIQFLMNIHQGQFTMTFTDLDEKITNCLLLLMRNRKDELILRILDELKDVTFDEEFLHQSLLSGSPQEIINRFNQPTLIEGVTFFHKHSASNFEVFIQNKHKFTPSAFNVVLMMHGNVNLIDQYFDDSVLVTVSDHLYQVYSNYANGTFIISENICEYVFDKYPSVFNDVDHFTEFFTILSDTNYEWYHKRGRIIQLLILRSYEDRYDHFRVDEIDLAKFFYNVVGKQYDDNIFGKYSLPYFVVHYPDLIKPFGDVSICWINLNFLFDDFENHGVLIMNQLEKMGIPMNNDNNVWADLFSSEAIEWFLKRDFPIRTKYQLESFLVEIVTCDALHLMPIFEQKFKEFRLKSDEQLTIFPAMFFDCLNFDVFEKLCNLGVIEKPKSLIYSFCFNFEEDEDIDEEESTINLHLTQQQLNRLK